ncbi:MAG: hypothetical protein IJA26_01405 [Clostridia bacterium]|nr:hypothetical protein [Clostridia bacterium]
MQQRKHAKKTAYQKNRRYGWFTLLWMVVFLPVGFLRMWRSRCRWPVALKYSVSGLMLAALALAFIAPSPYEAPAGGLELYGNKPEVEIYGPELPENFVLGYIPPVTNSGVLPASDDEGEKKLIVYATEEQDCYHLYNCKFAYASGRRLTLYETVLLKLKPCGLCQPPLYVPEETT